MVFGADCIYEADGGFRCVSKHQPQKHQPQQHPHQRHQPQQQHHQHEHFYSPFVDGFVTPQQFLPGDMDNARSEDSSAHVMRNTAANAMAASRVAAGQAHDANGAQQKAWITVQGQTAAAVASQGAAFAADAAAELSAISTDNANDNSFFNGVNKPLNMPTLPS